MLDIEEDRGIPLILGRALLPIARMIIDVYEGKLKLRVGDNEVEFNLKNMLKYPPEVEDCKSNNEDLVDDFTEDDFSIPMIDRFK